MAKKKKAPKAKPAKSAPSGSTGSLPPKVLLRERATSTAAYYWFAAAAAAVIVMLMVWRPVEAGPRVPAEVRPKILATYPHDPAAWTQGLLWHDGKVYEGTGLEGRSSLRRADLTSGKVEKSIDLPRNVFGEGLALVDDRLIQITWKDHVAFLWDKDDFAAKGTFKYDGEGWGLCYDGKRLIMSNGGNRLTFRDPKTFKETGSVLVRALGNKFDGKLNELECAEGFVYANIWTSDYDRIAKIDPKTGDVVSFIDASGLRAQFESRDAEVLNGIAYIPERKSFLITGKFWPKMFEVRFDGDPTP